MVAVHTIKRRTKTAEVKHGPAQPPVEALAGTAFTRDVLENFERNPLGRDVFRLRARLQEWDETEELHRRNRDAPMLFRCQILGVDTGHLTTIRPLLKY